MTDNEIIKALEHEISLVEYVDGFCADGVDINLIRNALVLINRQKTEINRLNNELHGKVDYIHEQQEVIDDLKVRYNKKRFTVDVKFDKEQLAKIAQDYVKGYELQINEIRAEAIRAFAKQLKRKATSKSIDGIRYVYIYDINSLEKEMTEGNNG